MKRFYLMLLLCCIFCLSASAEADKHLSITTTAGGQLKDLILDSDFEDMTSLTIQGPINAQDIQYITSNSGIMAQVRCLDLSDVELVLDGEIYHLESLAGTGMGNVYKYEYRLCDTEYSTTHWDGLSTTTTKIFGSNLAGAFKMTDFEKIVLPKNNTSIGERTFELCPNLREVVLSGKEKYIGERAFHRCESLEIINLPQSVDSIADEAFYLTKSLKHIELGNVSKYGGTNYGFRLGNIRHGVFGQSGLTEITVSEGCSYIPKGCFSKCSDTRTLTILGSVKSISDEAFYYLTSLSTLNLNEGLEEIGSSNFVGTQLTSVNLPSSLIAIGRGAFSKSDKLTDVVLPTSLQKFGEDAFSGTPFLTNNMQEENNVQYLGTIAYKVTKDVTSDVIIREGTTVIGDLFSSVYCRGTGGNNIYARDIIETLTLPSTLRHIGYVSFYNNYKLSSITLPEGLISIGDGAFYKSGLQEIEMPSSLKIIGHHAFRDCQIKSITLPENLEAIGSKAFSNTGITSITLPKNLKTIGAEAFADVNSLVRINFNCIEAEVGNEVYELPGYTSSDSYGYGPFHQSSCDILSIGEDVKSLPEKIFSSMSSSIKKVDLPSSLHYIGTAAFSGLSSLVYVNLPEGLEFIGEDAFSGTAIENITLPESLRYIGPSAFCGSAIKELNFPVNIEFIGHQAFGSIKTLEKVEYRCIYAEGGEYPKTFGGVSTSYYPGEPFNESVCSEFVIDSNVAYMMPSLLKGTEISTLYLDLSNLSGFNNSLGTKHLDKVVFSPKMKQIPDNILSGSGVAEVVLPPFLKSIGDYAFSGCKKLHSLEMPTSLESIGDYAFCNCENLSDLALPDSLRHIGNWAFGYATYAFGNRLSLPPLLEFVGDYAFAINKISTVFIPETVNYIGQGAFTFGYTDSSRPRINKDVNVICMNPSLPESNGSPFYYERENWHFNTSWKLTVPSDIYLEDDNWSRFGSYNNIGTLHCDSQSVFSPDFSQLIDQEKSDIMSVDGIYIISANFFLYNDGLASYSTTKKSVADKLVGKTIGTHDLTTDFHGIYILLPEGRGKVEVEIDPNFKSVQLLQGNGQHMVVEHGGSGIANMDYDFTEPTPLFIYKLEDDDYDASVIYSIKIIPDGAAVETIDGSNDSSVLEYYLLDGRRVLLPVKGSIVIEHLSDGTTRKVIAD